MKYLSTRGGITGIAFSEAVRLGLAPDGGLFLPEKLPQIGGELSAWENLGYAELCRRFFGYFATDLEEGVLGDAIERAYAAFSHEETAPLRQLEEKVWVLELFHGPTLAFKDFALQVLGNLFEAQIRRTGKPINVLGATSGDTGAAAIHGLRGREGVKLFILYPNGRVAPLQERQMACVEDENVFAMAIDGSFDDAQTALKETFNDREFSERYGLSAINSINLARILAQCVYYLYASLQLKKRGIAPESVEFVVPTGNFGNILAGWLVHRMGLPVHSLRVATNQNDILYRLFTTGVYALEGVRPSLAPSMDIQIASNFERFLYYAEGCRTERVCEVMQAFRESGRYDFENFGRDCFTASRTEDGEIRELIKTVYERTGYVVDPHTACGFKEHSEEAETVVLATAHPAKFPQTIVDTLGIEVTHRSLEALKKKPLRKHIVPAEKGAIEEFIVAAAKI